MQYFMHFIVTVDSTGMLPACVSKLTSHPEQDMNGRAVDMSVHCC